MNIVFKPYILNNLTGSTTNYSGVTGITSDIFISSGVTFNIKDFYGNITRIDLIDNIVNYIDDYSINKYMLDVLIVGNISGETLKIDTINTTLETTLEYCIKLSYNNEIEDYLMIMIGDVSITTTTTITPTTTTTTTIYRCSTTTTTTTTIFEPYTIYYTNDVTNELTGNTTTFSGSTGITSNIYISSGITFNLLNFNENIINRLDIIDNTINYIDNLDKYALDTLIVDNIRNYVYVDTLGEYCVKFSYNNIEDYLIMNVISGNTTTTTTTVHHTTTTTTTIKIRLPKITYNYPITGTSWLGGGDVIPYDAFLPFIHNGISGWTLDSLKLLFISGITDCYDGDIPLSSITFNLYKNETNLPLLSIFENGIYDIFISVTNTIGNTLTNYISNITVNDSFPVIIYNPYVIDSNISWNTNMFSGITSGITEGIEITSGFTFNISGFDKLTITRLDIIDNIVNYVYDYVDVSINKYMIDIVIVGTETHETVNKDGGYCVKMSIINSSGHKTEQYFIMNVISDIYQSCYSQGFWQDNKVWIDFKLWLDYPI